MNIAGKIERQVFRALWRRAFDRRQELGAGRRPDARSPPSPWKCQATRETDYPATIPASQLMTDVDPERMLGSGWQVFPAPQHIGEILAHVEVRIRTEYSKPWRFGC